MERKSFDIRSVPAKPVISRIYALNGKDKKAAIAEIAAFIAME